MRVLIVGAGGMLARELNRQWSASHEVIALPRADLDISQLDDVRRAVRGRGLTHVVNCAAYNRVDDAETHVEDAYRVNAVGPKNLAIAAEESGIPLVHFSTDYVFDGTQTIPYVEYDATNPLGVYARSKAAGEVAVREHCHRFFIVRVAWLVGHEGKNFVSTMLHIGQEKGAVSVVTDQIGTPTFCADVVRNLGSVLASGAFGLYHMTGNGSCSWFAFAEEIFRQARISARVEPTTVAAYGRPAPRPACTILRNLMLELTIGDRMPDWRESLKEYLTSA
jgi:dTDP-4-dehydrorhamnose reductase